MDAVLVERRGPLGQHDRQQRGRDSDRDERDQHPTDAEAAQERHRQNDEREQPDRDGEPAEHDGAAGGLGGGDDCLRVAESVSELFPPAGDDEQ